MGIMEATRNLKSPRWPFIPLGRTFTTLESMNTTFQPNHPLQNIGTGFPLERDRWPSESLSNLFSVIRAMCGYTVMVYNHCEGRAFQESLCAVADQRNFIQHKLMSLPENSYNHLQFHDDGMYEATRLAVIIYSFLVVYPASTAALPFIELSSRLRRQLSYIDTSKKTCEELKPFVWILFMGGIASVGSEEHPWFVSSSTIFSDVIHLNAWTDVKKLLECFLWLGSTNDADGMELWAEINQLRFLEETTIHPNPSLTITPYFNDNVSSTDPPSAAQGTAIQAASLPLP
jgi:hypothetical protein